MNARFSSRRYVPALCVPAGLLAFGVMQAALAAGEVVTVDTPKRAWGTEQVLGEPDSLVAGDATTAWASLNADEREWLIVGYDQAVIPKTVSIHENYGPGAVDKVTVFAPDGEELIAWEGEDPTPRSNGSGISVIPLKVDFEVQRLKIYIDSESVPDWNEIDAVGLTSSTGLVQWAVEAEASSTYAVVDDTAPAAILTIDIERLEQVEADIAAIREEVDRLKNIEAELREIKELLRDR